jgi:hypothetical protein
MNKLLNFIELGHAGVFRPKKQTLLLWCRLVTSPLTTFRTICRSICIQLDKTNKVLCISIWSKVFMSVALNA